MEAAGHYHDRCWARRCGRQAGRFWSSVRLGWPSSCGCRSWGVKTDAIDLEAITELVLAGHGVLVTARVAAVTELTGWAMHRGRRIQTRTDEESVARPAGPLLSGLTVVVPDVLGTRCALVAAEFATALAGRARGSSICQVRRESWAAGSQVDGGAAGGGCRAALWARRRRWPARC